MKAISLTGFGDSSKLISIESIDPSPGDNDLLIKIKAISINPADIKLRNGENISWSIKCSNPIVLGWDISGTVIGTGKNVSAFKIGDDVFGMLDFPGCGGGYAQMVAAPESLFALKPENVSHEQAAGATMAALTAVQAIMNTGKVYAGQRILIDNANNGIGHYAIQIAKHLGAHVTAISDESFKDFVIGLGADEHYDFKANGFELALRRFDFVLDTIGGVNVNQSIKLINWGGTLFINQKDPRNDIKELASYDGVNAIAELVVASGRDMSAIAELLKANIIKTNIDQVFSFDQLPDAHRLIEAGSYKGKIVVTL
jgi:NADPH:quinone reductase-like Zn-dependent oxidoreductase